MANLSNINNKFIVTDGGQALVNQTVAGFNPDADDLIVGNLSGNTGITIASGSSAGNYGSIYFADGAGSSTPSKAGFIRYEQNTSEMTIGINAVPKIAIDISGNTTIEGTVQVNGSNATVINDSDPNFTVSDTDTNYRGSMRWLTSSNVLEFFTRYAGTYYTNNLVLDRGKVGIGTDSPSSYDAEGDNLVVYDAVTPGITIALPQTTAAGSARGSLLFSDGTSGSEKYRGGIIYDHGTGMGGVADTMYIRSAINNYMVLGPTGNVGIGTKTPGRELEVVGVIKADGNFISTASSSNTNLSTANGGQLSLFNSNSTDGNFSNVGGYNSNSLVTSQINFVNDSHTSRTGSIAFMTHNGSNMPERMRIDSSGNVGIAAIPGAVNSSIRVLRIGQRGVFSAYTTSGNVYMSNNVRVISNGNNTAIVEGESAQYRQDGGTHIWYNAASVQAGAVSTLIQRMRIKSSGEVGISNTNPLFELCIGATPSPNRNGLEFAIANSDAGTNILQSYNRATAAYTPYRIAANTVSVLSGSNAQYTTTFADSGNFGIGTTSPDSLLQLESSANPDVELKISNTATVASGQSFGGSKVRLIADGTNGDGHGALRHALVSETDSYENWEIRSGDSLGTLCFDTQASEKMRITSGGDVLFRNTAIPSASSLLGSGFKYDSKSRMTLVQACDSTALSDLQEYFNPNGAVGKIQTSGSSTIFNTSSDYRLKEDLKDFDGLTMVSNINVYDFKWKIDGKRSYGVLAHELQEVMPDAAAGEKDLVNEDGSINPQGVDYSKIVPILVKAIQELKAEIEILKNK